MEIDEKTMEKMVLAAERTARVILKNGTVLDENDSITIGDKTITDMKSLVVSVKRANYKKLWIFAREKDKTVAEVLDSILDDFNENRFAARKLITPIRANRKDTATELIAREMIKEANKFLEDETILVKKDIPMVEVEHKKIELPDEDIEDMIGDLFDDVD